MQKEYVVMFDCVEIPASIVIEIKTFTAESAEREARKLLSTQVQWICTGIDSTNA